MYKHNFFQPAITRNQINTQPRPIYAKLDVISRWILFIFSQTEHNFILWFKLFPNLRRRPQKTITNQGNEWFGPNLSESSIYLNSKELKTTLFFKWRSTTYSIDRQHTWVWDSTRHKKGKEKRLIFLVSHYIHSVLVQEYIHRPLVKSLKNFLTS